MNLFNKQINNWQDWEAIFQSISVFASLIEHIIKHEKLPFAKIENLTPGTNAVFKVGGYVVKIFAPKESGFNFIYDMETELFATTRAYTLSISVPKVIASGVVEDKYQFAYIIFEYIDGKEFTEAVKTMTDTEKNLFGQKLRLICDKMNTSCEPFNGIDIINDKDRQTRWDKYPEKFKKERAEYIRTHDFGKKVFVHGDIGGDNIIISADGEIYLIDFADAVLAPIEYEHELIAIDVFNFDPALLQGFFGSYITDGLTELCFNGLLIHDFGADTIEEHLAKPCDFQCLDDLRKAIEQKIKK